MTRDRYVFDTNVLVSALLFSRSQPGRAFFAALSRGRVVLSRETLEELSDVLGRKKFTKYLARHQRDRFLEALVERTDLVSVEEQVRACRDPKDDKFLELAVAGDASVIISGDKDLLTLSPYRGIAILTPTDFLSLFGS